jgi:hypothetical protein
MHVAARIFRRQRISGDHVLIGGPLSTHYEIWALFKIVADNAIRAFYVALSASDQLGTS